MLKASLHILFGCGFRRQELWCKMLSCGVRAVDAGLVDVLACVTGVTLRQEHHCLDVERKVKENETGQMKLKKTQQNKELKKTQQNKKHKKTQQNKKLKKTQQKRKLVRIQRKRKLKRTLGRIHQERISRE
ncbi:hypothetical protein FHG87_007759 [Trinorchestia longiramus]|nr:hypothetical protein FHG87_007759 [Trinorchestia longiramus]